MERLIELAQSFVEYAGKVESYAPLIAGQYRENKPGDAEEQMLYLLEGMDWMITASMILDEKVDFNKDKLVDILRKINTALENGDFQYLADVLQYDLVEIVKEIKEKYGKFISDNMN